MSNIIKMHKKFFNLIKDGKKNYEFRKLSKGITSGTYTVIDAADGTSLGKLYLKPIALNPKMVKSEYEYNKVEYYAEFSYGIRGLDKETYNFVKENYQNKNIEFLIYECGLVK